MIGEYSREFLRAITKAKNLENKNNNDRGNLIEGIITWPTDFNEGDVAISHVCHGYSIKRQAKWVNQYLFEGTGV